jgi:type I restriction enzyme M protein
MVTAFENWWEKYRVTLPTIEHERSVATASLAGFLKELGYDR